MLINFRTPGACCPYRALLTPNTPLPRERESPGGCDFKRKIQTALRRRGNTGWQMPAGGLAPATPLNLSTALDTLPPPQAQILYRRRVESESGARAHSPPKNVEEGAPRSAQATKARDTHPSKLTVPREDVKTRISAFNQSCFAQPSALSALRSIAARRTSRPRR
jgi:hypothetical protein